MAIKKTVAKTASSKSTAASKAAPAKAVTKPAPKAAPVKSAPKAAAPAKVTPAKAAPAKAAPAKPVAVASKVAKAAPAKSVRVDKVIHVYSPESGSVAVAGDFNGWDPSKSAMVRDSDGNWSLKLKLAPGQYKLKIVFDGSSWEKAPGLPDAGDEHGNSLLEV